MNNLINVQLFGDYMLGRKLIAEYLYCGNAHECSAYADGRCFMVKTWLREKCKYGSIKIIEGGGDNQKVMMDAVESPCYGKLKYPIDTYISKIGGDAYFTLKYVSMRIEPTGRLVCNENSPFTTATLASEDMLTPECIMQICSAHPGGIDGELVTMYQSKIVPHFLLQLSKLFPDKYNGFMEAYPEFKDRKPDWRGHIAKLSTCNRSMSYKDYSGNVFRFDGEYLVCDDCNNVIAPFRCKRTEMRVRLTDDMTVKITDAAQVTESTEFIPG